TAPCPFRIAAMFQPRVILHPTDFSELASQALVIAADLARRYQAELLVLHVAETIGPGPVAFGEVAGELEPEGARRLLDEDLHRYAPLPVGVPGRYLTAVGDPTVEIVRAAREHRCDLIVLGTHGRTGLIRVLSGSIAEEVIRHAPCPVLVTRGDHPEAE